MLPKNRHARKKALKKQGKIRDGKELGVEQREREQERVMGGREGERETSS